MEQSLLTFSLLLAMVVLERLSRRL